MKSACAAVASTTSAASLARRSAILHEERGAVGRCGVAVSARLSTVIADAQDEREQPSPKKVSRARDPFLDLSSSYSHAPTRSPPLALDEKRTSANEIGSVDSRKFCTVAVRLLLPPSPRQPRRPSTAAALSDSSCGHAQTRCSSESLWPLRRRQL